MGLRKEMGLSSEPALEALVTPRFCMVFMSSLGWSIFFKTEGLTMVEDRIVDDEMEVGWIVEEMRRERNQDII